MDSLNRLHAGMLVLVVVLVQVAAAPVAAAERVLGPCEGCEAVFQGRPATLGPRARIAPEGSPGEPLQVEGTVRDAKGRAAANIIVYAYQTDHNGLYPRMTDPPGNAALRHGRYRGFVVTDSEGRYRFDTIRPAGYPGTDLPQHIHLHVVEPGRCTTYLDDIVFEDDPRLTPARRASHSQGRGGPGIVRPLRDGAVWKVRRDIVLGEGIPNYAECRG